MKRSKCVGERSIRSFARAREMSDLRYPLVVHYSVPWRDGRRENFLSGNPDVEVRIRVLFDVYAISALALIDFLHVL